VRHSQVNLDSLPSGFVGKVIYLLGRAQKADLDLALFVLRFRREVRSGRHAPETRAASARPASPNAAMPGSIRYGIALLFAHRID